MIRALCSITMLSVSSRIKHAGSMPVRSRMADDRPAIVVGQQLADRYVDGEIQRLVARVIGDPLA